MTSVILQTVLDALRARKERFVFEDIEVTLKSTVMAFITMNPGYPGRAELPESLKVQSACPQRQPLCWHFGNTAFVREPYN